MRAHIPAGGVFVDVGANVGTMPGAGAPRRASGKVIAIEPHPVTHARLAFNRAASGPAQVTLVAAAAGPSDGELMIETDGDNLGASHIVSGKPQGNAIRVPSLRLQRILDDAGVTHVDALKIDVEGYEDRVLTGFFAAAPQALWPRAVVIEHLSREEWQSDCIADMRRARLCRGRQDPQQHVFAAGLNLSIGGLRARSQGDFDDRPHRFPVSDYARAKAFYAKALAPLGYSLIMEVTQEQTGHDPRPASAPTASRISGSAAKAG